MRRPKPCLLQDRRAPLRRSVISRPENLDVQCTAREFGLDLGDCFHDDEIAEAEAQGLSYILVPRELSREEWEKEYCHALAAEEKKD
jgi:hypothetical protein